MPRRKGVVRKLLTSTVLVLSHLPLHEAFSPSYPDSASRIRRAPAPANELNTPSVVVSARKSSYKDIEEACSNTDEQRPFLPTPRFNRNDLLREETQTLMETSPGTLVDGKWRKLITCMKAWSKRVREDRGAPLMLERLLKRVIDERQAGNADADTNTDLYNLVIDGWTTSTSTHGKAAARRARDILQVLQQTYEVDQDPQRMPSTHSFVAVLQAMTKAEDASKARDFLYWMEELCQTDRNPNAQPSLRSYVTVLDAFAESRTEDAGVQAESLLRHMNSTDVGVSPNTLCYNIVIKAYVKSKRGRPTAEHAERILEEMHTEPDDYTYGSVLNAWATSGMKAQAAERAEEILRKLEDDGVVQPNIILYNSCLNAWCKSGSPHTVNRTEALLARMEASDCISPDIISYNTYLHALAMNGKEPGMAKRAEDILNRLEARSDAGETHVCPNRFSYNLVIEAYARSRNRSAATQACSILQKLVQRNGVEPDVVSFNQVISALSRSSMPGAAQKAEELLLYMDRSYESGVSAIRPDVVGYSSAITAWARSGEPGSAERAERLLNQMEVKYSSGDSNVKPNVIAYNAVIDSWARSGEGTLGARRAEALLQRMQAMVEAGDKSMQPNIITYNSLLNAWARSGTRCCGYKAEGYLESMWELYEGGNKRVKPDGKSYNTVINAVSKSKNEGKAQKALRILRRMELRDIQPNEFTYTAVLNSCAFPAVFDPTSRRKALHTAIFTLEELQGSQYGEPNHITYGTFLKACANLMPADDELRRVVVEPVFIKAREDGQVSQMVLSRLRDAAPADLYKELLADVSPHGTEVTFKDLPLSWRCNVREQRRWKGRTRAALPSRGKSLRP